LEERDKENARKMEGLEEDLRKVVENTKLEVAKEKERNLKIAKLEVRMEVVEEVETEYREKMEKIKDKYEKLLREEKAASLPILNV
jgi:hypothetical protein